MRVKGNNIYTGLGSSTQLVKLIRNYKLDPPAYQKQLTDTITKIIRSVLSKEGYTPIRKELEEVDDLIQDLRLLCLKLINKSVIEAPQNNPTSSNTNIDTERMDRILNKKVYNYLTVSLTYALMYKLRKISKMEARSKIETALINSGFKNKEVNTIEDEVIEPYPGLFLENSLERKVSNLLANGYTKREVRNYLCLKEKEMKKVLQNIKDQLERV